MNLTLKQLNKFVNAFLLQNADAANQNELWMEATNQKQVKSLLSRANRSPKDPKAPKRGKSSYLYFCADNREKVKKSLGKDAKATNVTRELGVRWNKLKKDKKNVKKLNEYIKKADIDKERYKREKAAYTPPESTLKEKKKGPKRAQSAYLYFCSENRAVVKKELGNGVKATDVTKELGVRWNKLKSEGNISKFEDLAAKDKKRYLNAKNKEELDSNVEEEEELVEETPKKTVKKAPKKTVKKAPKKTVKKVKGKRNGYQIYCSRHRAQYKKDNPGVRPQDITRKISADWKRLSDEEKESYKLLPAN